MIKEALSNYGFDDKEIKIYLACLKLGESPASIIAKKTDIQRELVYVILKKLEKKGIASKTIRDYKNYYSVILPETLISKLDEKKDIIKQVLPEFKKIINKSSSEKPDSKTFEGKEGIKTVFNNILTYFQKSKDKKILLGYGSAGNFEKLLKWSFPHFIDKRVKQGIKFKGIYSKTKKSLNKTKLPLSEIKFLPKEFESPTFCLIYPDHIAIIIFNEFPIAIVINSKEIYNSYKLYFKILWEKAK